jgi:glycosyltransferase involved in cell wall biosynthesis
MSSPHKTIKIAYLIDFFGTGGGTENQLALLLKHLDRSCFTPYLFTLRPKEVSAGLDLNCPVEHLGVRSLLSWKALRALRRFRRFLKQNHIDILQLFFIDSNIFGILAGKPAAVPVIIVSRRDMGWWYHQKRRHLTNILNRLADYCLANSYAVKAAVNRMETIPAERTEVIYNGVTEGKQYNSPLLSKESLGIPADAPVVGIVANLKPIKRIDRFLRAASLLKRADSHFIILGSGNREDSLKELAAELGLSSRIHFHHTVDQARAFIALFDVGVLTSESEGLSNALIEYAMAGVPAVAFDTGGNKEVIADGRTGFLVPAFDEAKLAERIDTLLDNTNLARQLGEAAQERARRQFSVQSMVQKTQDFYRKAVEAKISDAKA